MLEPRPRRVQGFRGSGLLSNQGEKSIIFYFIRVLLRKKVLKDGTPKPRFLGPEKKSSRADIG